MLTINNGEYIVKKNSSLMGGLVFKEIDRIEAKEMMIKNHYSHKWNTSFGKINIGIFRESDVDKCLGCASFGNMMNPKSYKSISDDIEESNIIELNRLWIDDCLGKNAETLLLSASWIIMRNKYPEIKIVQSFADGRLGCGTIYKAASFKYYGYSESLFYENIITGETQHKVPMENTSRPKGMTRLNKEWCEGILKPFKVKTYRYLYLLDKKVNIKIKQLPYPEYDKGINYIDDYKHNSNLLFRAWVLSFILNKNDYCDIFKKYCTEHFSNDDIKIGLDNAISNKSIVEIIKNKDASIERKEIFDELL